MSVDRGKADLALGHIGVCPRVSHREIKTFISRTVSGEGADALIVPAHH